MPNRNIPEAPENSTQSIFRDTTRCCWWCCKEAP